MSNKKNQATYDSLMKVVDEAARRIENQIDYMKSSLSHGKLSSGQYYFLEDINNFLKKREHFRSKMENEK